ncbi:hypothetical protein JTB14_003567 [Gonioctena quinquepunctata]|nr:hypothetical protein JTB14_003567 [Gonioctena quinquepunctata]
MPYIITFFSRSNLEIKKVVKKSETVHRHSNTTDEANESWVTFKLNQPINNEPATLGNSKEQREAFREFLQNRQVLKMKAKREQKNYIPDSEYLKEELRNSYLTNLNKFDIISSQEEDYIIEDDK